MIFNRELDLSGLKRSAFIFGPRMTGKTFLLRKLSPDLMIDLVDPELELSFRQSPRLFWEQVSALKYRSFVIVDEIQRVPALLDYVQKAIEEKNHIFILSGSSARKLKRGGANLLGGRAKDLKLHPLTSGEIGKRFDIKLALQFGSLPKVVQMLLENDKEEARSILRSYSTIYIKEEIQAEAITRNIGAFQRFLNVACQDNGQIIEFANISRECSVPMSTVKEYYSILEDTLLGVFLSPWDKSERKKARAKFYFFDCGVIRAVQNRLNDPPTPVETGMLFECWFMQEMMRIRDYKNKSHQFSFWREGACEIDLLISDGHGVILGVECKAGRQGIKAGTIEKFRKRFPKAKLIVSSLADIVPRRGEDGIDVLPWNKALDYYRSL